MPRISPVPPYSLHRHTGQARVRIDGRDYYLGIHGSPESRQKYAQLIAERFRPGGGPATPPSSGGTINSNGTFNGTNGTFAKIPLNEMFVRYAIFISSAERVSPSNRAR